MLIGKYKPHRTYTCSRDYPFPLQVCYIKVPVLHNFPFQHLPWSDCRLYCFLSSTAYVPLPGQHSTRTGCKCLSLVCDTTAASPSSGGHDYISAAAFSEICFIGTTLYERSCCCSCCKDDDRAASVERWKYVRQTLSQWSVPW